MNNSQARTGHQRGMGGRGTDDDDTHERRTDTNRLTRHTASWLPHTLSCRTHNSRPHPPCRLSQRKSEIKRNPLPSLNGARLGGRTPSAAVRAAVASCWAAARGVVAHPSAASDSRGRLRGCGGSRRRRGALRRGAPVRHAEAVSTAADTTPRVRPAGAAEYRAAGDARPGGQRPDLALPRLPADGGRRVGRVRGLSELAQKVPGASRPRGRDANLLARGGQIHSCPPPLPSTAATATTAPLRRAPLRRAVPPTRRRRQSPSPRDLR